LRLGSLNSEKPGTTGGLSPQLDTNPLHPSALEEKSSVPDQQAVFVRGRGWHARGERKRSSVCVKPIAILFSVGGAQSRGLISGPDGFDR
jgi:hypothetical protein